MSATKKRKTTEAVADGKEGRCENYINGQFVAPTTGEYLPVENPTTGKQVGDVAVSAAADVDAAVAAAQAASGKWAGMTVKSRCAIIHRLYELIRDNEEEIAELIVLEHGKNFVEALGDVRKGNETVEYACSMPQLIQGKVLEVSRGVECKDRAVPRGVVASIVPFNFPAMVPLWTMPIALAVGNCVILKPSEKVPLTFNRMIQLFQEAGFPAGVVQIVNGTVAAVTSLCDHPGIDAVSFVGSSKVAEIVSKRCRNLNKPVIALGGAKNHLVAVKDCNVEMTAQDVVNSFSGCSGQRCMAASVLLTVGPNEALLNRIVEIAGSLVPGREARQLGPVIDKASQDRILSYIENTPGKILLDGRGWATEQKEGYFVGPTVILHTNKADKAMQDEIFGPVISIYECKDKEEAIAIENGNPYGNAACIYTSNGAISAWFADRFSAGMIGVNVGVPVPREPFSFGGWNASKFGDCDITGEGCMRFFTKKKKITTKWHPVVNTADAWMS